MFEMGKKKKKINTIYFNNVGFISGLFHSSAVASRSWWSQLVMCQSCEISNGSEWKCEWFINQLFIDSAQ